MDLKTKARLNKWFSLPREIVTERESVKEPSKLLQKYFVLEQGSKTLSPVFSGESARPGTQPAARELKLTGELQVATRLAKKNEECMTSFFVFDCGGIS